MFQQRRPQAQGILTGPEETRPEVSESLENSVAVAGMQEAEGVDRAPGLEGDRIAAFAVQVEAALAGWSAQRGTPDLTYDTSGLNRIASTFRNSYIREFQRPPSDEEVRAVLLRGTNRDALREINSFLPASQLLNADYFGYLGLSPADQVQHEYHLQVLGGASVSAILGGQAAQVQLTYSNDAGMAWDVVGNLLLATAEAEVGAEYELGGDGLGASVGGLGAEALFEGDRMTAMPTRWYFSPDDFNLAQVYTLDFSISAEAGVHVGPAHAGPKWDVIEAKGIALDSNGRRLSFFEQEVIDSLEPSLGNGFDLEGDEQERRLRLGLSAEAGASMEVGIGAILGTQDFELRSEPSALREEAAPSPQILLNSTLHFRTGEAGLGPEDRETLTAVLTHMLEVEASHPGALFDLDVVGFASNRWRAAGDEAEAIALNRVLAAQRATNTITYLRAALGLLDTQFRTGVQDLSDYSANVGERDESREPDDDDQTQRAVTITVTWRPAESNVDDMLL